MSFESSKLQDRNRTENGRIREKVQEVGQHAWYRNLHLSPPTHPIVQTTVLDVLTEMLLQYRKSLN